MKVAIMEEEAEEAIRFVSGMITNQQLKSCNSNEDAMKLYSKLSRKFLKGKFISPSIFEKDKKLITSVVYSGNNTFSIITENNELFQKFNFKQLQELIEIGAIHSEENNYIDNFYCLVK